MRVVAISGSLKQSSANSALVQDLADLDPELVEVWGQLGELPHFTPDGDGGAPVESLRAAVAGADLVLLATPEYAGGMPGSLKNALDWLVGSGELYDKDVAIVSAAPSPERGANARRWVEETVGFQGSHVVASFTVTKDDDPAAVLTAGRRRAQSRQPSGTGGIGDDAFEELDIGIAGHRAELHERDSLRRRQRGDHRDLVTGADVALADDAEIGTEPGGLVEAVDELGVAHADPELEARLPGLCHLELGRAHEPAAADHQRAEVDALDGEVLAERPRPNSCPRSRPSSRDHHA